MANGDKNSKQTWYLIYRLPAGTAQNTSEPRDPPSRCGQRVQLWKVAMISFSWRWSPIVLATRRLLMSTSIRRWWPGQGPHFPAEWTRCTGSATTCSPGPFPRLPWWVARLAHVPQVCDTPEPNLVSPDFAKHVVLACWRPMKAGMRCGLPLLWRPALPAQPGVGQQSAMPFANLLGFVYTGANGSNFISKPLDHWFIPQFQVASFKASRFKKVSSHGQSESLIKSHFWTHSPLLQMLYQRSSRYRNLSWLDRWNTRTIV